jgi:RNA polymerase sigma-70 factor, ECF subfamily
VAAASPAREHDVELAHRAAGGDRAAQRELFLAQRIAVHHTLFRILGSNRDLEDLLQDSFFEIFRSLASFRGDSTLATWCRTIATRTAFLAISRRREPTVELALIEDSVADGDADARRIAMARDAARRLYAALDRIDARQRIAFALAVIDGLPIKEVARLTDSTITGAKTRIWRARRELFKRAKQDPVLRDYIVDLDGGDR